MADMLKAYSSTSAPSNSAASVAKANIDRASPSASDTRASVDDRGGYDAADVSGSGGVLISSNNSDAVDTSLDSIVSGDGALSESFVGPAPTPTTDSNSTKACAQADAGADAEANITHTLVELGRLVGVKRSSSEAGFNSDVDVK